jgi:tetratricopeptide (TPR) repeat protein
MVKKALELNPVNVQALQWQYQQAAATASAGDRFNAMLALLRANPNNPNLILQVSRELASAGLVKESLLWYQHAGVAWGRARQAPPLAVVIEVAAEMFIDGQMQQAMAILDQIIKNEPDNYPALVMRLLIEKTGNNRDAADRLRVQARNALINAVAVVRGKMGVREATTRPVNEGSLPQPDLGGDIDRLKRLDDAEMKNAYLQAVGDLAWFELFFSGAIGETERLLGVIRQLSDPEDPQSKAFIARMEGWLFYLQGGKIGEATVKLSAAAERDPLAALGLVKIYWEDDKPKARAEAAKLLNKYGYGLQGAMIFYYLRDMGVKVAPNEKAPPMQEALAKFPRDWMRVLDAPQQFYMIRGEPVKVSVPFGEPLLVTVSIQNIGDYDLTIGDDGLIKPGLWFDVQLTGLAARAMAGVAYERITERVVLKPKEVISKTVRIDQGGLAQMLNQNPGPPVAMVVSLRTNPIALAEGILSGPGGFQHDFPRRMERASFPANEAAMGQMATMIQSGESKDKLRAMELMVTMGALMVSHKDATPEHKMRGDALIDVVSKARTDADPNVRAWSGFLYGFAAPEDQRAPNALRMLQDEAWQPRLLGLAVAAVLPRDRFLQLAKEAMEKDSVDFVKEYAKASIEKPLPKPTTQPAAPIP